MQDGQVRKIQQRIFETMKYIDRLCRANGIIYYIMGGTALGAVRHGGFIPWDDDLDIFMTPDQYAKFKTAFERENDPLFVLQEWKTTPDYLEYAKVRMNGTTFIEHQFRERRDLHQGIYVDIMILHKVPKKQWVQRSVYLASKYVTLYGLSQRGWKPKSTVHSLALAFLKILPNKWLASMCYTLIYRYDGLTDDFQWCYWITKANFHGGLFDRSYFEDPIDIPFEDTVFLGSASVKEYLSARYGDYMKLPSVAEQKAAVHAAIYDTEQDYTVYMK